MKEVAKGLKTETNRNGFTVAYLHYSADPDKSESWAEEMRKGYLIDIWNQEMELDFTKATGRRVYPEFQRVVHVTDLVPIPYETIWRGWDFGYHHPACVWFQIDSQDNLLILAELMGNEIVINRFAQDVIDLSKKMFPGWNFKDAGDPAVRARSDKSERTSADILRGMDIRIQSKNMLVRDGINMIRNLLLLRPDGKSRLKINTPCQLLISGFMGEYLRNEDTDEPIKDGFMEHILDALRYGVTICYNPRTYERIRPAHVWVRKRATANVYTGY